MNVPRFIAQGVNDDAATHRAVRADTVSLRRPRNLQLPHLFLCRSKIESERRCEGNCGTSSTHFEEIPAREIDWLLSPFF